MRAIDLFEEAVARRLAAELDRLNVMLPPIRPSRWWPRLYIIHGTGTRLGCDNPVDAALSPPALRALAPGGPAEGL